MWLCGRYGSGKTALAFEIARKFLEDGYKLITNTPSVWSDDVEKIHVGENGHVKAVVILDEAGLSFTDRNDIKEVCAYSNKMDMIYLFPSFFPPHRLAQIVSVEPITSFRRIGIHATICKWSVNTKFFKDSGKFFWANPKEVYGIYSRQSPGSEAEYIIDNLIRLKDDYEVWDREKTRSGDGVRKVERRKSANSEGSQFIDAAEIFADAAEKFGDKAVPRRGRRYR